MSCTPKVSVIIPVYNTAEFLRQCLDSIVNQTLQDIEIICVDDGSTDASLDILHEYASNDSRITILTQQNRGAGAARNTGIQIAHGEYLAFFDSDDFFDLRLLEKVTRKGDATNADIVMFGAKHYNNQTHEFSPMDYILNTKCLPNKDSFSSLDVSDCIFQLTTSSPWSKLFRRSFSEKNGLKFQDLKNSEDILYVLSAISIANRISLVNEKLVSYRVGLNNNLESRKNLYPLEFYKALLACREFLLVHNLYFGFERSFLLYIADNIQYNFLHISQEALPKYARENIVAEFGLELRGNRVVVPEHQQQIAVDAIPASGKPYMKFKPELTPKAQIVCDTRDSTVLPFISVIIPIYNVEKYLKECLDSVVNQTLHNIEIICVDDGSTDNSLEIAKSYAANDNRFIILHQANKGLSAARNAGLLHVRGTYIHFLDSDDIIETDAYALLYKKASLEKLDVLRFEYKPFYNNEEAVKPFVGISASNISHEDIPCTDGEQLFCLLSAAGVEFSPVWAAIYRAKYLRSISLTFIEGMVHEDNPFTFICTLSAKRIAFVSQRLYMYRTRAGSIMTIPHSYRNLHGYLTSYYVMSSYALTKTFRPETQKFIKYRLDAVINHVNSLFSEIPDADKFCSEYELFLIQSLNLKTSPEYRIGHFTTFIPRKILALIQYYRVHGLRRTLKHVLNWIK